MRFSTTRVLAVAVGVALVGASAGLLACSSKSSTGGGGGGATSCSQQALEIVFNPMYSAYDGTDMYQIPAIVNGIESSAVTWSSSDDSLVSLAPDPSTGGVMITTLGSGSVNIIASAGGLCGSSPLNITAATTQDWQIGNARYNDGNAVHFGPPGGHPPTGGDAGTMTETVDAGPACTNCHGPTAMGMNVPFSDIAHTPEQTGGFSDDDLINIVVNGQVPGWTDAGEPGPDAGYFDTSIISYSMWHRFHQWTDITSDEQLGIVVYLRSLAPAAQSGSANFGGHFPHDGGMGGPPGNFDGGGGGGGDH
jgi:hypothetical protein